MTAAHATGTRSPRSPRHGRGHHRLLWLPLVVFAAVASMAFIYVVYVLWPRWPGPPVGADAPALPITIAGVTFNVPPAAIRVPVQRRPGAQERLDLAFLWPSLDPPDANAKPPPASSAATAPPQVVMRVFMTISAAGNTLAPTERMASIYPRYAAAQAVSGPGGLAVLAFRDGTPYQGEDLIYDAAGPGFLVRCSRDAAGPTPGICLYEQRIETADVTVRFPRDWLDDWHRVADTIDRLVARLRPAHG
jgi:hypothetical protein